MVSKTNVKIKIYTRSMNYDLYRISQKTIKLDVPRIRSQFTSADGYLYFNLLENDADYVINIDEDAFVIDNSRLVDLIEFVIENDYINCGMPDGGIVDIRKHNPLVTNPFFNIINVKEIRKRFNLKEIISNYSEHQKEFENFCPKNLNSTPFAYDYFEPYNAFFVWLAVNFKTLYLDADEHDDGHSTILKDHHGKPFILHSWYSRFYGKDGYHTKRINNLYTEATGSEITAPSIFNRLVNFRDKFGAKYYFPLKMKIEAQKKNRRCI